jgi:hypothetical protein
MNAKTVLDTLTLGQKELLRGRFLRQCDACGEPSYCVDCLADLPDWEWWEHRCGIPQPVAHKTQTFCPMPETGRFTKRGRPLYDRSAVAWCTCGWKVWESDRVLARRLARSHREDVLQKLSDDRGGHGLSRGDVAASGA